MEPKQFFETVFVPNLEELSKAPADYRTAVNAIMSADVLIGFLFLAQEGNLESKKTDGSIRQMLSNENEAFRIINDAAASLKHGRLDRPPQTRTVRDARLISEGEAVWDDEGIWNDAVFWLESCIWIEYSTEELPSFSTAARQMKTAPAIALLNEVKRHLEAHLGSVEPQPRSVAEISTFAKNKL